MNIETYNDWYVRTDGLLGPWTITSSQTPTTEQEHNATKIYNTLMGYGWSKSAVCGIIGNMQHESTLSPALIEQTNRYRLPNSAANLSDVPNSVMQNFYKEYYTGVSGSGGYGIGLCQWDGKGITRQKLVGYCENNGYVWYDGDAQMARLMYEYTNNKQWQSHTYYGIVWTWSNYVTNDRTPEESARIWCGCYEVSSGITERQDNARYWYDYFDGTTPTPVPDDWVSGETFAGYALAYEGQYLPYTQYDCIGFVNLVWKDIPIVSQNGWDLTSGTNRLWRSTRTFNTTDPNNNNPTNELWYKDTIANCEATYGGIPTGALLFHKIGEDDTPQIPDEYRGDGIGNFAHVGIYCGNDEVMQSGGSDGSSVPGGGVHKSAYDSSAWNYVAFVVYVDCSNSAAGDDDMPIWLQLLTMFNRRYKRYVKRVI